uniref:Uncharacterized protein n=1 Tax=Panagrolaimus sp. JU765 TaxID=591449 RepID=A0AC34RG91_9BILA
MNQPDQKSKDADLVIVLTWCLCGAVIVITAIVGGLIIYCVVFRRKTIQNNEKGPGQQQASGAVEGKANDSDTDSAKLGGYFKPPKIPAVIKPEISEENEFLAECG